ncbi:MAG: hypothetical protein LBP68_02920 [Acidobacteriota bacterium]|jgi:hypothetical protein|nr:hypothetical protein [Acidobacteriota bacterium]
MCRFLLPALLLVALMATSGADSANAQAVSFKNFNSFQNIVPGVDFFASNRQTVAPYEKAAGEALTRLKGLFDDDLPTGAIFICSNLAQKDSLYEPMVLKRGYAWVLISVTSEVRMQEMLERVKSRIGDNMPEEMRRRMSSPPRDMMANVEQQAANTMSLDIAYAVLQSMLGGENFHYRSNRVEDVGKSPLPDWLDIGIAAYASDNKSAIRYLRDNIDQAFSIEDVISMSRPFVGSTSEQGGGFPGGGDGDGGGMPQMGGGFPGGGFPGGGQGMPQMGGGFPAGGFPEGGFPGGGAAGGQTRSKAKSKPQGGNGGEGNMPQRNLSKSEQDRMLFDGQSITFFDFFLEKYGVGKMKELIQFVREKNETREYIIRPDVLGDDFSKIEAGWSEWLNAQPVLSVPEPKPKFNNSNSNNNRNRG